MTSEQLAATQRKAGLAMIIVAALPAFLVLLAFSMDDKSLQPMKVWGAIGAAALAATGGLILKGVSAGVWVAAALSGAAGAGMLIAGLREGSLQGMILGGALLATACPWFVRLALQMRRARRSDA